MTVLDDWGRYLKEQVANAEKWAKENPLAAGFVIITVASVTIFVGNKLYDMLPKS